MKTEITYDEAIAAARKMLTERAGGMPSRALLWNMLSTRARNGQSITDFSTMAMVSAVVGKENATAFVAAVRKVWKA